MELGNLPGDATQNDIMQMARIGDIPGMEKLFQSNDYDANNNDPHDNDPNNNHAHDDHPNHNHANHNHPHDNYVVNDHDPYNHDPDNDYTNHHDPNDNNHVYFYVDQHNYLDDNDYHNHHPRHEGAPEPVLRLRLRPRALHRCHDLAERDLRRRLELLQHHRGPRVHRAPVRRPRRGRHQLLVQQGRDQPRRRRRVPLQRH